ncbi:NlpC/P60 family protein [Nocardioides sp. GY 10127]|uniref:C40 family peptidase n=1 Tax=Nocardioides sp. GY 10127 TaxID=2569762 RepID=UPI001458EAB5|nr:NlpC/P60 family protein [Nocardioides sp. GY 10127]
MTTSVLSGLTFVTADRKTPLLLTDAITDPPKIQDTMDGAGTITIVAADPQQKLLTSGFLSELSWARYTSPAGVTARYQLVAAKRTAGRITLTYEDAVAAQLRMVTSHLAIPKNTSTRSDIVKRLAVEGGVRYDVDPGDGDLVRTAVRRSPKGEDRTNSWDVLGSDIADPVNWRRFSDGRQLVVGSDAWLRRRSTPTTIRENHGSFGWLDFDLDAGTRRVHRASQATIDVDADWWTMSAGDPITVADAGPADGNWLVSDFTRTTVSTRGTLTLVRGKHEFSEAAAVGKGDRGEKGYAAGRDSGSGTNYADVPFLRRMVDYALKQEGKPYVWGASGPNSFDCSGLVQAATAYAGKTLGKPSETQWGTIVAKNMDVPVADAMQVCGGLLFRIGVGDYNHVAISLGNGSTIEAMGTAYGVCKGSAYDRGWTGGGVWR